MNRYPLVSILLPVYNAEKHIEECLNSILCQTYKNFEIVISDDSSQDRTQDILKEYKNKYPKIIRLYLQKKNLGITANCNFLLSKCEGEYICFFAGDDVMLPTKIEKQLHFMENNLNYSICGTSTILIDDRSRKIGKIRTKRRNFNYKDVLITGNSIVPVPSYFVRASMIKHNYDVRIPVASDYLFFFKIAMEGNIYVLKDFLTKYRVHYSSSKVLGYDTDFLITLAIIEAQFPFLGKPIRKAKVIWYYFQMIKSVRHKQYRNLIGFMFSSVRLAPIYFPYFFFKKVFERLLRNV